MKAHLKQVHWGQVLLTGVGVLILVVLLNSAVALLALRIWGQQDHGLIAVQVDLWSTTILDFLVITGGGIWIARKVKREAPLHGLLVGLLVALIFFLLDWGFSGSIGRLVPLVLGEFVLAIVAGWLGGVLGSRRLR